MGICVMRMRGNHIFSLMPLHELFLCCSFFVFFVSAFVNSVAWACRAFVGVIGVMDGRERGRRNGLRRSLLTSHALIQTTHSIILSNLVHSPSYHCPLLSRSFLVPVPPYPVAKSTPSSPSYFFSFRVRNNNSRSTIR